MNIKRLFYLCKINIAKVLVLGCIFLFGILFANVKVDAVANIKIISSTYSGNGNNTDAVTIGGTLNDDGELEGGITFIQGTGVSNYDGVTLEMTNMYTNLDDFTAFAIWESSYSDSSQYPDYDRWYLRSIECKDASCTNFINVEENEYVVKYLDPDTNTKKVLYTTIVKSGIVTRYYIEQSKANIMDKDGDPDFVKTVADFSEFFTNKKITYTYRIRNANYANREDNDGFGYKEIEVNFWKANDGTGDVIDYATQHIKFGLAKAISDVDAYTNYDTNKNHSNTNPVACVNYKDYICVDYVDTNGLPSASTTQPKDTNIYIPDNVLYAHSSTSREDVINNYVDDEVDMDYVSSNNTLYGLNYFCEGDSIEAAVISYDANKKHSASCQGLRKYLYVDSKLVGKDIDDEGVVSFVNKSTSFVDNPYQVTLTVDTRGSYVIVITDVFGNTNEAAIVRVTDIINQALIAYFNKSNKTTETVVDADGWKANEYFTNNDVTVTITMTATTVIEQGLPIISATTTLLDSKYVKNVYFWRVDGSKYTSDVCQGDAYTNCAMMPDEDDYTVLYSYNQSTNTATKDDAFVGFELNKITMKISSNGRYRFYIETFAGNTTNENVGEKKNPRVEVYKIDKQAPVILFGGSDNSNCSGATCKYVEETYEYYKGTGNTSGTIVPNMAPSGDGAAYTINYTKDGIYYVSADGKNSLLASAGTSLDTFFNQYFAMYNSELHVNEVINYYGATADVVYSYFYTTNNTSTGLKYVENTTALKGLLSNETSYREYVISNNIEYTAYSLATNAAITFKEDEPSGLKIEYYDATTSDKLVCDKLAGLKLDLNSDEKIEPDDCVNYYLDHGIDFKVKVTIYDVVQDGEGKYILGNEAVKEIYVDVQDTTAPGFNKIISNYNVGSECRIEIGNVIGKDYQTMDKLLECYGIYSDSKYNYEDNVFSSDFVLTQKINTRDYIEVFVLDRVTKEWISLDNEDGYTPNRSGQYSLLIILRDASTTAKTTFTFEGQTYHDVAVKAGSKIEVDGNAIATVLSYYVDKKLVVIAPESNEKDYGDDDPTFDYCVYVNSSNQGVAAFLEAPFADMTVFGNALGCTKNNNGVLTENELRTLFKGNYGYANFKGSLDRQESASYNKIHIAAKGNEFVGVYQIVLGTLTIEVTSGYVNNENYNTIGEDYIVKIDPRVRGSETQLVSIEGTRRDQNQGNGKCNLVNSYIIDGEPVSGCYGFKEDDDFFVESSATLTIKQVVLTIRVNGSSKYYGEADPNSSAANSNRKNSEKVGNAAYLNGYTVTGLKNSDTAKVVLGVLRREVGENVGVYAICNYRGTTFADTTLETINNMLAVGVSASDSYTSCSTFDVYNEVAVNVTSHKNGILYFLDDEGDNEEFIASRSLYIAPNVKDGLYKTLNVLPASEANTRNNNYANYVINFVEGVFKIEASTLVVQPAPGQRREYSYSGVDEVNPWEVVIYGNKSFAVAASGEAFTGYTQDSPVYAARKANDAISVDEGSVDSGSKYYNNASESRDSWKLIRDGVTYTGLKTNETYSLFKEDSRISLKGWTAENGLFIDMNAGWYDFNSLSDSTLEVITNARKQCKSGNVSDVEGTGVCKNYNLVIDLDYRNADGYKNGDKDASNETVSVVYKSKMGYCKTFGSENVSDPGRVCSDAQSSKILFEVYRREIILEFNSLLEKIPSNNKDMVYGYRYDYYVENLLGIDTDTSNDVLENELFYCYTSYKDGLVGLNGDCTSNEWYGLTKNDTWARVGLEFHLHSLVSATTSGYYDTDTDSAIPAGRYYVYSTINDNTNYKYNYLGGTLTIKTKVVNLELTDYIKEYGDVFYSNITCETFKDGSILNASDDLIGDCSDETNTSANTYGFIVDGLDEKDNIKDNFKGRPIRDSNLANSNKIYTDSNGLQENVGVYTIKVGSIKSKNNNSFKACEGNFRGDEVANCVVVEGVSINNYITSNDIEYVLTYYLLKNGTSDNEKDYSKESTNSIVNKDTLQTTEATLTINPATIDITVTKEQTKMYGCAYNGVNVSTTYKYTYANGYEASDCVSGNGSNYDLGYEYTVSGDKDYYIYVNGYYTSNYDFESTYTSSKINMVTSSGLNSSLLTGASGAGLRSSALNGGVLYRISNASYDNGISLSTLVAAANNAQGGSHYQGQSVGSYIITLGNINAHLTSNYSEYKEANNKVCDASNVPGSGNQICRNYIINYYGNKSTDTTHEYETGEGKDTTFTITKRVAFIYAKYNSKVYGNPDPVVSRKCDQDMIDEGLCDTPNATINYGISYYYTKYNSLAKAPYVASIESGAGDGAISFALVTDNDVQTDVVNGALSRIGMNNGDKTKDDFVGTYNYLFTNVTTTDYSSNNYTLNYFYRTLSDGKIIVVDGEVDNTKNPLIKESVTGYSQSQAVNEDGGNTEVIDGETKNVLFEINLRKITVSLISFAKVYGIEDNSLYYDLGICSTDDENMIYDEKGNALCTYKEGKTSTEHGLSDTHKGLYVNADGTLKQKEFKEAFKVTFLRALGENVSCSSGKVSGTLSGYFPSKATSYSYDLDCNNGAYEALGVINQSSGELGYNYEITYVEGTVSILARTIVITPDSNQGFQYGSYTYPSLIPAITFTNSLASHNYHDGTKKVVSYSINGNDANVVILNRNDSTSNPNVTTSSLGLVNGGNAEVCLKNIDNTNTFCINDRQDVYDTGVSEVATSSYAYNGEGKASVTNPTYVFGDVYSSESSVRHALNRIYGSNTDARYNRNVGTYTIVIGDLVDNNGNDLTGNYSVSLSTTPVTYTITPAAITVTPSASQNKVYGEADKELKFSVETTYTVNSGQYITFDESIIKIVDKDGNNVDIVKDNHNRIKVEKGSTITLNGFAYYENNGNNDYNYGKIKDSNKSAQGSAVSQNNVKGKSYDKYCYDNYDDNSDVAKGIIAGCSNKQVSFESTTLVLIGYLYVTNYNQKAGEHLIANDGMVVSDNELGNKNYNLSVASDVNFEIIKLDINLVMVDIAKIYGQATDGYKCETGADCDSDFATLTANDNENMLEHNFDITYKNSNTKIASGNYSGELKVLMVSAINGKYYTQSEGEEDKNHYLGISVIRKVNNDSTCTIDTDEYGCEDVGTYTLSFRKVNVIGAIKDGSDRYDDNYNLMISNEDITINNIANDYIIVDPSTHGVVANLDKVNVVDGVSGELVISKRSIDIFVNTNLNSTSDNYYEIEQNIVPPNLPSIDNTYDLNNYTYDPSKIYHGLGEDASSKSDNTDLDTTYTKIVWGNQPKQVRTSDALTGSVAYCNEPSDGNKYPTVYPGKNTSCANASNLVYNSDKNKVNTNTKDRFIVITRDASTEAGLKILSNASLSASDNTYEIKNYEVSFYPGAIHIIGDSSNPTLVVGNKDYYIEANAKKDNGNIVGSSSSLGTILEYLFNGADVAYILARVDDDGNLSITIDNKEIDITQASLYTKYGNGNEDSYPGIVSGVEQRGIRPFISNSAHMAGGAATYLNEDNITSLEELITTFVKWFEVSSYDSGQFINGQYLERKFDKYYYLAINKFGYDIAGNIDNLFAINKVGTYTVSFYVMDNAGRVSADGNTARLHIIDTTAPVGGELTLYGSQVMCEASCHKKDQWYIKDSKVRLSIFNRYSYDEENEKYVLDGAGEYIYYSEIGSESNPYKKISDLSDKITTENYIDYIDTSDVKYSAVGIIHYVWSSNPDGIYLTITGGSDNSYTANNSANSQWKHQYSIDGGFYWLDYELSVPMSGYHAIRSDGIRTITSTTIDSGVNKIETNYTYSISYDACYEGCESINVINKVQIDGRVYEISENDISNKYFIYDEFTRCVINRLGTTVTCTIQRDGQPTQTKTVILEGNKFTYNGRTYLIQGHNIMSVNGGFEYKLYQESVTIGGVSYRLDRSAMLLYREYIGEIGIADQDGYIPLVIEGKEYSIFATELLDGGVKVADIENYSFKLGDLTYKYIESPSGDYYLASKSYQIYQDSFIIDGATYNISSFNALTNTYSVNQDILRLTKSVNYTTTYELYDRYLVGVDLSFVDSTPVEDSGLYFRLDVISNVGWKKASSDAGSVNEEISSYTGKDEETLYYTDKKVASLDTTAPLIGLDMVVTIGTDRVNVNYGDSIYTYEHGYDNIFNLTESLTYKLNSVTYTIDKTTMTVKDSNNNSFEIKVSSLNDDNKKYVYYKHTLSTNFYIDKDFKTVSWLYAYRERFVGGIDTPSDMGVNTVESGYYNLSSTIYMGKAYADPSDVLTQIQLITSNTSMITSSGLGSDQYATKGKSDSLYDFVYLGSYGEGIYHKDIDYIVHYTDPSDKNKHIKIELDDEFEACYLKEGKITRECAQQAISGVVSANNALNNKDIIYTINYVIRDKAGNASRVEERGAIYATILPSTNVVVNNVEATLNNSPVTVEDLGDNTYSMVANQGVSLELLESAFKLNYSTRRNNYNDAAVMTIYRDDEVIAENVKGVAFTKYINSDDIGEYKIVYSMNTTYDTWGDNVVDINGEVVTLHLSIKPPVLEDNSVIKIDTIIKNESSPVFIFMILGFIGVIGVGVIFVFRKKR